MRNKLTLPILLAIGVAWLTLACQSVPGFEIFASEEVDDAAGPQPHSNFVPPRASIQIDVDQPLPLESYHFSRTDKLKLVRISINGQPLRAEETAAQPTFPEELAITQVLTRGQPARTDFQILTFPSPNCRNLLAEKGGPVQKREVNVELPSSTWVFCHIWIGYVPGAYDLSLVAVDQAGREGQPIVQRIEVVAAPRER